MSDHPELFARLPVQRQGLLEERLRPGRVSVVDAYEAGPGQRQRPLIGRQVLAAGQRFVPQAGKFREVAAEPPEPPGHQEQVGCLIDLALVHQPGHRGPQVVVLGLQPAQPGQLRGAGELGGGRLGQGLEIGGVPVMRPHPVAAAREAFKRILPDGLQQREPRLVAAGFRADQAAVHQRAERFHHRPRPAPGPHRGRRRLLPLAG